MCKVNIYGGGFITKVNINIKVLYTSFIIIIFIIFITFIFSKVLLKNLLKKKTFYLTFFSLSFLVYGCENSILFYNK